MTTPLWWTLTLCPMLIGLAGTVLPLLPGTTIIPGAGILHFASGAGRS